MDPQRFVELQSQMKHNQADIQSFVKDLDSWESEIKQKDAKLKGKFEDKPNTPDQVLL